MKHGNRRLMATVLEQWQHIAVTAGIFVVMILVVVIRTGVM